MGGRLVMETRNPCRTINSREMSSKCLENEGATKEPPPFLRVIRHMYDKGVTDLFVIVVSISVQKLKIFEVILGEFHVFFIKVL